MSKINIQELQRNRNATSFFVNLIRTSTVFVVYSSFRQGSCIRMFPYERSVFRRLPSVQRHRESMSLYGYSSRGALFGGNPIRCHACIYVLRILGIGTILELSCAF